MADRGFHLWQLHYGRQSVWVIWRLFSIMADRGFEQDEDLSLLWKTEGLTYIKKTCLHYGRQRVGVIWRLVTIMADRGFELYGDLFLLCPIEGLSKMKTCLHYERKRVFLHHGWQSVFSPLADRGWARWRFISIMENTGFDLSPL